MPRPLTVVGLGPGPVGLLTLEARQVLEESRTVYLRTARHPTVADLPAHLKVHSFDEIYDTLGTFEEVYATIVDRLLALTASTGAEPIVYAVPGHPLVAEATVPLLLDRAREGGVTIRIVAGLSFLEPTLTALGEDLVGSGLQLLDAVQLASKAGDPFQTAFAQRLTPARPLLIHQLYNRTIASGVKLGLARLYPDDHPVKLVVQAGLAGGQAVRTLPLYEIDRLEQIDHLTSLYVPPLPLAAATRSFGSLVEIVNRLRAPGGCPWDREQTHETLKPYLIEEAYEALQALDAGDLPDLCAELGDLLLQILLHAQVADEAGEFALEDTLASIGTKLIRRHPHVFGSVTVSGAAEVLRNWEQIKAAEREQAAAEEAPASALASIPSQLPALAYAQAAQERAALLGFRWQRVQSVLEKLAEEVAELQRESSLERRRDEFGDVLFVLVNLARWLGLNAEDALRAANRRFRDRFSKLEQLARERSLDLHQVNERQLLGLWAEAKAALTQRAE